MKIPIKRTHIRRGEQSSFNLCPIGLAIQETLSATKVKVDRDIIKIGKNTFATPPKAIEFIEMFDDKKSYAEPFVLEL